MKAKGLEALASAAAGSPQVQQHSQFQHFETVSNDAESAATAISDVTATPTSSHKMTAGINLSNLTPQQQQQILQLIKNQNNAANHAANQVPGASQAAALLGGLQQMSQQQHQQQQQPQNPLFALQQQIASQQLLQLLMNRQQQQQQNGAASTPQASPAAANGGNFMDSQNAQNLQALLENIQSQRNHDDQSNGRSTQQLLPKAAPSSMVAPSSQVGSQDFYSTVKSSSQTSLASAAAECKADARKSQAVIAPAPPCSSRTSIVAAGSSIMSDDSFGGNGSEYFGFGDKKQQKRAANRKSAQLSRKRKKLLMEELKDENDDLRRKEQILKSIPDLIVVFDSTGKLWFVSDSVSNFVDFSADELEGSSIWDRLCKDSVRLLKAAFMDSLAARRDESSTAPLGQGFWELRLMDRDGSPKVVTLNGVVHFAGERPECVCSIRPVDKTRKSADGATEETHYGSLIRVKPFQSVVSNGGSDSSSNEQLDHHKLNGSGAIRISDSGNSGSSSVNSMGESEETGSGDD
ncbi:hypothetical protein MPSEU_000008900 [Mayamaea pseudoterrestris]|nr:hypothetical protein MPSEU_000008900 [Mayamaea pseudoterrestris]